jgi:hypothetical protein
MQPTPPAPADGWALARSTPARQCPAPWCSPEIFESCLDILVHEVVREFLFPPLPGASCDAALSEWQRFERRETGSAPRKRGSSRLVRRAARLGFVGLCELPHPTLINCHSFFLTVSRVREKQLKKANKGQPALMFRSVAIAGSRGYSLPAQG